MAHAARRSFALVGSISSASDRCWTGAGSPALRLYPRKTMNPGDESWKPLPVGLWRILVALQVVIDAHAGSRLDLEAPLMPAQLATPHKRGPPRKATDTSR